eukprot:5120239-Ditylum_brightwellii.AAC.1
MLQSFSSWNLSADELAALWHGEVVQRKRLIKWECYSVACEEMMTFVSPDEATTASVLHTSTLSDTSHLPIHAFLAGKKMPQCSMIFGVYTKETPMDTTMQGIQSTSLHAVIQIAKLLHILSVHLNQC